jgi:hypothetical protein
VLSELLLLCGLCNQDKLHYQYHCEEVVWLVQYHEPLRSGRLQPPRPLRHRCGVPLLLTVDERRRQEAGRARD